MGSLPLSGGGVCNLRFGFFFFLVLKTLTSRAIVLHLSALDRQV